jgi:membrane protease YdiL (CAAX protease family)
MTRPSITERRSPLQFFLLVFVLAIPLWWVGALHPVELLPGLPLSSLAVFCPVIAASILVCREAKRSGVTELLKRAFDYGRTQAKVWYVPTVLVMPGISLLAYGWMRLARIPLPALQSPGVAALLMLPFSFIAALGEELGWSGYAIDPLQDRWNALRASILLGLVTATWHFVPLLQADRSATWIAWWSLAVVAERVIQVWLYNNTGKSVLAAAVFHATVNIT